jgi:hypothetical protein
VIGTVRSPSDEATAKNAGAHEVLVSDKDVISRVRALAADGIDHIVEVAFGANIEANIELLKQGGSIASYATENASPKIPFWQMVFKNIRVFFLGSDDFPKEAKMQAARDLNAALEAGWPGFEIGERIPLVDIARARACGTPGASWASCRCAVTIRRLQRRTRSDEKCRVLTHSSQRQISQRISLDLIFLPSISCQTDALTSDSSLCHLLSIVQVSPLDSSGRCPLQGSLKSP